MLRTARAAAMSAGTARRGARRPSAAREGNACATCPAGDTCVNGACQSPSCSASNCPGCSPTRPASASLETPWPTAARGRQSHRLPSRGHVQRHLPEPGLQPSNCTGGRETDKKCQVGDEHYPVRQGRGLVRGVSGSGHLQRRLLPESGLQLVELHGLLRHDRQMPVRNDHKRVREVRESLRDVPSGDICSGGTCEAPPPAVRRPAPVAATRPERARPALP